MARNHRFGSFDPRSEWDKKKKECGYRLKLLIYKHLWACYERCLKWVFNIKISLSILDNDILN